MKEQYGGDESIYFISVEKFKIRLSGYNRTVHGIVYEK